MFGCQVGAIASVSSTVTFIALRLKLVTFCKIIYSADDSFQGYKTA
jgi:hypothetical protein